MFPSESNFGIFIARQHAWHAEHDCITISVCPSVRPSVRLQNVGIVPKRMKISV